MRPTKIGLALAALCAFGPQIAARAVTISPNGQGQVLLYPYYTVQGGMDTVVSIINTRSTGKAMRVRFREGKGGQEVLQFNLYLGPHDAWAGVVTRDTNGNAVLKAPDRSCTVPHIPDSAAIGFRNYAYVVASDGAGSDLDRAREGYVEIIEMGEINPAFHFSTPDGPVTFLDAISTIQRGAPPANCQLVNDGWARGGLFASASAAELAELTAPKGGLIGSGTLINVTQGTDYSYDPTALDQFTTSTHHTLPDGEIPSLSNADPISTAYVAFVSEDLGAPPAASAYAFVTSTWTRGEDAVSAALMHSAVLNEYSADPELGAGTDLIFTFPTRYFYVRSDLAFPITNLPRAQAPFSDLNPAARGIFVCQEEWGPDHGPGLCSRDGRCSPSGIQFLPQPSVFSLCWTANVATFGDSSVLASQDLKNLVSVFDQSGWIIAQFHSSHVLTASDTNPVSYIGLPVIGFAVQRFVNGNLNGVLSNYGGVSSHKYESFAHQAP